MEVRNRSGEAQAGPRERFVGAVAMEPLVPHSVGPGLEVASVHFSPGARTNWHAHPKGQVLLVTDGAGLAQSRGGEVHHIHMGDAVVAEAGEWHWHGAGPSTYLTHTAIQPAGADGATAEWGEPVTDEEYGTGVGSGTSAA
jgi:quercetin dioxygenase-like cupin family protein